MASALFLGVDGGGTGCRARFEDGDGNVLGQGIAGPATTRLGLEKLAASIETAWRAAAAEASLRDADLARVRAGFGIAGFNRKGFPERLRALPHPFASAAYDTDAMAACLGAHDGADGAIVIVGTGSVGIGRVEGRDIRVGGYGFPISDEGSGADLGLRAVRLALRAHDGRHEPSAALRAVMARFGDDPIAVVEWMDRASATEYATLAPLVMRHADSGDPAARRIVQGAAEQIDGLVRALIAQGAPRVALLGGLASAIEAWLSPDVRRRLTPPLKDAVSGAIRLARA